MVGSYAKLDIEEGEEKRAKRVNHNFRVIFVILIELIVAVCFGCFFVWCVAVALERTCIPFACTPEGLLGPLCQVKMQNGMHALMEGPCPLDNNVTSCYFYGIEKNYLLLIGRFTCKTEYLIWLLPIAVAPLEIAILFSALSLVKQIRTKRPSPPR